MKPDWKDAPEWAQYLAMDEQGRWCWYENEPIIPPFSNYWNHEWKGKAQPAKTNVNWRDTLEKRP